MLKEEIEQMIKATNKETNKLERELSKGVTVAEQYRIKHKLFLIEERRRTLAEVLRLAEKYDKTIKEMAEFIANVQDCPNDVFDCDLDCEHRCGIGKESECWEMYFREETPRKLQNDIEK